MNEIDDMPHPDRGTYIRVQVNREMLRYLLKRSDKNGESMSKYVGRLIRLDMASSPKNFSEKNKKGDK